MAVFHTFGKTSDIPPGAARSGSVKDNRVAVFNLDGKWFALDDRCPHAGASLALGQIEADLVVCRIHHWKFCLRDGACVENGDPQAAVPTYPVRIVDGEIQVEI